MPIIKNGQLIEDTWQLLDESVQVDDGGPAVDLLVTCQQWRAHRELLLKRNGRLGILLRSDEPPTEIVGDLEYFDLVALDFPKFTDGRAYSYARLLRERYGYIGELRATGHVLRDQYLFMQRCGFDSYEVTEAGSLEAWNAALSEFEVVYQPTADERQSAMQLRQEKSLAANWAY